MPVLAEHVPLLITDLGRTSLLDNPELAQRARQGQQTDGSSTGALSTDRLRIRTASRVLRQPARVRLGAHLIPDLADLLPARLGFDRDLWIFSPNRALEITAGPYTPLHRHGDHWAIRLTPQQVHALSAAIRPRAGSYSVVEIPNFELLVERTTIRNRDGDITGVIG